jgi:hypothetical protein
MLIGAGIVAILTAIVWRHLARRARLARLDNRLRFDDDAAERARAGNALVELGLPRAAKPILRAMVQEPDDRVRLSVALAIARRQWEPARAKRVVNVRGWASEELDFQGRPVRGFGPAITRLADMGGPRPETTENGPDKGNGNGKEAVATATNGDGNATNGNGNGNGANGHGRVAAIAYRVDEPPPAPPGPPAGPGVEAIRWVAPGIAERTES